jgi:hypothetical protein
VVGIASSLPVRPLWLTPGRRTADALAAVMQTRVIPGGRRR